jgi:hypothetical protein
VGSGFPRSITSATRLTYVFNPFETAQVGICKREWAAMAATEEAVVAEMARCLREISAGRVPK